MLVKFDTTPYHPSDLLHILYGTNWDFLVKKVVEKFMKDTNTPSKKAPNHFELIPLKIKL